MSNYQSIEPGDLEQYSSFLNRDESVMPKPDFIRSLPRRNWTLCFVSVTIGFISGMLITHDSTFFQRQLDQESVIRDAMQFMTTSIFHQETEVEESAPLLGFPGVTTIQKRPLVYLNRPDAYALLIDSTPGTNAMSLYSSDYFLISSGLDAQINPAYSAAATVASVLNSLRFVKTSPDDGLDIPVDDTYTPFPYATQVDIFNDCTAQHVISHVGGGPGVDGLLTPPYGLNMDQVTNLIQCHLNTTVVNPWKVTATYVDETHMTLGKMRYDIKGALGDPNSRVVVNYDRSAVGQIGGGHWSPIGAYSDKQDAFLLLDVAKYKYPPVWIPTERLFDGLSTLDDCGKWNYPYGQAALSKDERVANSQELYSQTMVKLGCQPQLRGYIVISKSS